MTGHLRGSPPRTVRRGPPASGAPSRLLVLAAVLLVGLAGCSPTLDDRVVSALTTPPADASRSPPTEQTRSPPVVSPRLLAGLRRRVARVVSQTAAEVGGPVAVSVVAPHGHVIYQRASRAGLLPASTQKLVTAAAALRTLGPQFRYTTVARVTAPPDNNGTVDGDLVLVGSGDPALATPAFDRELWPDRPVTPLSALADRIAKAGVRRITGNVVGDPSVFAPQPLPPGWNRDYLQDLDGTRVAGLTVDAGRRLVTRGGRLHSEPSSDPVAEASAALRGMLKQRGVAVGGAATTRRRPGPAIDVASVTSPPLETLLAWAVAHSDNHMADAIFRTLGAHATGPDATWGDAAHTARLALDDLGLDWRGIRLADGSGLSRRNRLTAAFLTELDLAMANSEFDGLWRRLMAIAGRTGTLRRRLRGTPAAGVLRAKTGTLADVTAMAGFVETPSGDRYHLAVIGNGLTRRERNTVRQLQDDIVLRLVDGVRGCDRPPRPRAAVRCPAA